MVIHKYQITRLIKKYLFPKKYEIPNLHECDYPLPPFPNSWYPVCFSSTIKKNQKYTFSIAGREIILFRNDNGRVKGIPRHCPHMGVDLKYGKLNNNCVICPFHCKSIFNETEKKVVIEDVNNLIFIWIGEVGKKPPISIKDLLKENDMGDFTLVPFLSHWKNIGGHLNDFCEHLLDVKHAPFIHGVDIDLVKDGLKLSKHSFKVSFKIQKSSGYEIIPIFTYATPSFGSICYFSETGVFIMFIVRNIGDIQMVITPGWKGKFTVYKFLMSVIMSLYTYIDFSDESAYFSTKKHDKRNLSDSEKMMDDFRKWFTNNFYTQEQRDTFNQKKELYTKIKLSTDW